ncbi:hypothetical protein M426DRAFT_320760 [Hypoxylon sp. CI-4A]|nr:hypothetical protein M426DRAFT_320760 [Hypoxylon sp. CI-4A]
MVTFNLSYTAPINPAGSSPTLTQAQIWTGLQRKVRLPQEFVPIIKACTILSEETLPETGNLRVVREAQFLPGSQPACADGENRVREVCTYLPPCKIEFAQPDGSSVENVVSTGPDGELLMTYVFEWRFPGVDEGSAEAKRLEERSWKTAKIAVHGSIDTIRRLVKEGEI